MEDAQHCRRIDVALRQRLRESREAAAMHFDGRLTPPQCRTFQQVMDQRLGLIRLDIARRGFMGSAVKVTLQQEGLRGVLAVARVLLEHPDPRRSVMATSAIKPYGTIRQAALVGPTCHVY